MYENSAQIVDALRIRLGVETDAAVAGALGVHNSAVGHWRAGRTAMSPAQAVKAAELLGVEPGPLILVCLAETERQPALAALYRQLADRLGRGTRRGRRAAAVLAALAIGTALGGAPAPSQGGQAPGPSLYIRLNRLHRPIGPTPA